MVMARFCARVRAADLPTVSIKDIYQHRDRSLARH
jgi:hypothetical protein